MIQNFTPNSLVPDSLSTDFDQSILNSHTIYSGPGIFITIESKNCLNFASPNLFGLNMNQQLINSSIKAIENYAVGACGPRQFYGTMDSHLDFEKHLANWIGSEDCVNYCYPFSTTLSIIPAFVRNSDICFIDEGCWFAVKVGSDLSRSTIVFYHHNDLENLESLIIQWKKNFFRWDKCNRWVISEGLFANDGTILNINKLIELRKKFFLRIILDETYSIGSLGQNGKGICEHFNIQRNFVEVSIGSLGTSFGSLGGFAVGTKELCSYQRLASYAYIFSASPPSFSVVAASKSLDILQTEAFERIENQRKNSILLRMLLNENLKSFSILGSEISPIVHIKMNHNGSIKEMDDYFQSIVDFCLEKELAISKTKYVRTRDLKAPLPALKLFVSAGHSPQQIEYCVLVLKTAIETLKFEPKSCHNQF